MIYPGGLLEKRIVKRNNQAVITQLLVVLMFLLNTLDSTVLRGYIQPQNKKEKLKINETETVKVERIIKIKVILFYLI